MIRSMVMNIIAWESRNNCFLSILRDGIAIKQSYLLEYFALLFCVMIAQGVWRSNEILAAVVIHSVVPDTDMKIWKSEAVENEAFSLNIPLKNYRNGGLPQSGWMRGIPRRRRRLWQRYFRLYSMRLPLQMRISGAGKSLKPICPGLSPAITIIPRSIQGFHWSVYAGLMNA